MFKFCTLARVREFCRRAHGEFGFLLDSGDGLKYGTAMRFRYRIEVAIGWHRAATNALIRTLESQR